MAVEYIRLGSVVGLVVVRGDLKVSVFTRWSGVGLAVLAAGVVVVDWCCGGGCGVRG